jgi:exo-beta-1,3-glucanase (GH17 family)
VLGVLIGNEGITFKRYEPEDLTLAVARLRKGIPKFTPVPVSTSEPLVGYQAKCVREFGDFLAPNIHPVFDQPQFGPAEAATWAREEAAKLAKQTEKPVLLKETGFPHDGKPAYTPATQKEFWAAYLKPGVVGWPTGAKHVWTYYGIAFDAFDLPWKAEETKLPIEKSWGLFSAQRQPYPALSVWPKAKTAP